MSYQTPPFKKPGVISDIFNFPWIPFQLWGSSVYEEMGARGSVLRLTGVAIAGIVAILIWLLMIIGGDPYIPLSEDLHYPPFLIAFVLLNFASFLVQTTAHFLCFRALSGKGNLTAHSYIAALLSFNSVLLYWIATIILFLIASFLVSIIKSSANPNRYMGTFILVIGSLYLLYPSLVSLKIIHKVSVGKLIGGLVLSIIVSIPLQILHLFLFAFIREARPYKVDNWLFMAVFSGLLFTAIFILTYMWQQQRLIGSYPEAVPIQTPLEEMLRKGWVRLILAIPLISLATFSFFYFVSWF